MSKFIDTAGGATYGIALCGRCSRKFKLADLTPDPNSPGLMVCRDDLDDLDPYRLAPRGDDQLVLPFVRPDTSIAINPSGLIVQDGTQFIVSEDNTVFIFVVD